MLIPAVDPRLTTFAPLPPANGPEGVRLERFRSETYRQLAGQVGPLANLRSSAGCAWLIRTDSPTLGIQLERLRHHQPTPCHIALEMLRGESRIESLSADLREREGSVRIHLPTGLELGQAPAVVSVWLPPISTCSLAGIELAEGALAERVQPPRARWLAIGDSLTQGFVVSSPLATWVHRLARRWHAPAYNLGVGGIRIEPGVFARAVAEGPYDLVTIALGANHAWNDEEAAQASARAAELAALAAAAPHRRIAWLMPSWKPFEDGKGPSEFAGVPLDRAAGARIARVRAAIRAALQPFAPRIQLVEDLAPHDHRLLPDGLHPQAFGAARYAEAVAGQLSPPEPADDGETPAGSAQLRN